MFHKVSGVSQGLNISSAWSCLLCSSKPIRRNVTHRSWQSLARNLDMNGIQIHMNQTQSSANEDLKPYKSLHP